MENKRLKQRMYFFVAYNLSAIQQGIQAGHAALRYAYNYKDSQEYINFIEQDETWIILNGGTSNKSMNPAYRGSLNIILENLTINEIPRTYIEEVDLNEAVTAICFLADERVWDYEKYPDLVRYILDVKMYHEARKEVSAQTYVSLKMKSLDELKGLFPEYYDEWLEFIGGRKNLFLRNLIKDKELI